MRAFRPRRLLNGNRGLAVGPAVAPALIVVVGFATASDLSFVAGSEVAQSECGRLESRSSPGVTPIR